ncbi:YxiJ family protein [Terribacillus saccharophilus]|uniref:YxiJ family protein n=1 Tax=Terribacillus saccharophilus TaxID=361277 RepID=UPI003981E4AB
MEDYKYLKKPMLDTYFQQLLYIVQTERWPAIMGEILAQHELRTAYPRRDFIRMMGSEKLPEEADHLDWLSYWSDICGFVSIISSKGRLTSRHRSYLGESFFDRHPIWHSYQDKFHHYKEFDFYYKEHEKLRFYILFFVYQQQKSSI